MSDTLDATAAPSLERAIADHLPQWTQWRHDFHRHPELAFEEQRTSARVAELLTDWGYEVTTGIASTGVVGTLAVGTQGPSIGLRADMDALPIAEQNELDYQSQQAGKMHACGHDGHTTSLLAAAQLLAERRQFKGTLHVIFQPAEENAGGGKHMVDEGLFERFPCDAVFGFHNMPGQPLGQLAFREGPTMAAEDEVDIVITGQGGHGAAPHTTTDPIVAAASLVTALQTIVARNVDPLKTAVVTIGAIHGGNARNVIPDQVTLNLTVRTFDDDVREQIEQRIKQLAQHQAESFGARAEVNYQHGYPVLSNHAEPTRFARQVGIKHLGEQQVAAHLDPIAASEDFAYMLKARPGSYLFIGNGDSAPLHNAHYNFNDAILPVAARYWVALVEEFLVASA